MRVEHAGRPSIRHRPVMDRKQAGCHQKVRYLTRKQAKKAAKAVAEIRHVKGLRPYVCPDCEQWHLGHRAGQATHRRFDAITGEARQL